MEKVLAVTLFRRPDYTRQMLASLAKCYGIGEYTVMYSVDRDPQYEQENEQVVKTVLDVNVQCKKAELFVQDKRLGVDEHKLWLLPKAFDKSDFVIALEDDIVPGVDFLLYMEWARQQYANDPNLLSVCGYNKHAELRTTDVFKVWRTQGFHAWGWGMFRHTWNRFFGDDAKDYRAFAGDEVNGRFDWYLSEMANRHELFTVKPCVARVQNIGREQGEHSTEESFKQDHNLYGVWNLSIREWMSKYTGWYENDNSPSGVLNLTRDEWRKEYEGVWSE